MMQDVHVKSNHRLPLQKQHSTRRRFFSWTNWTSNKEETREMLRLKHSCIWSLKETWRHWKLKKEATDCILYRARFRKSYAPVAEQTTWWWWWWWWQSWVTVNLHHVRIWLTCYCDAAHRSCSQTMSLEPQNIVSTGFPADVCDPAFLKTGHSTYFHCMLCYFPSGL